MFSDPALYALLRREVIPVLRTWPFCRIWHAGVDRKGDVFSTAVILREAGLSHRATVYATDTREDTIDAAKLGVFEWCGDEEAARRYRQSGGRAVLGEYLTNLEGICRVKPELIERVVWSLHDPLNDASFNEFQLIVYGYAFEGCFVRPALKIVHESLCSGGFLVVPDGFPFGADPLLAGYQGPWESRRLLRKLW